MEIDRILYIFGSFTRKKQDKRNSLEPSSISAGNSPLQIKSRRPDSQDLKIAHRTSAYEDSRTSQLKEWNCGICRKELVEPRLLACLHSFCTRCLQGLPQEGEVEEWSEADEGSMQIDGSESRSGSGFASAGSGYVSDLRLSDSDCSWEHKPRNYGIFTRKISGPSVQFLICPSCRHETQLPLGGISALPLNYVLLRKMAAAQDDGIAVLCDLCNSDTKVESRCVQCLVSACASCGAAPGRRRGAARRAPPATYCTQHPTAELSVYCATCQQVVCGACSTARHAGHALGGAARAAAERARRVRAACARAALALHAHAQQLDSQAARVEAEVQARAERCARALRAAAARHLRQRTQQAMDAVKFAEELLAGGTEEELLSLSGAVLRRLEQVAAAARLLAAPDPDTCLLTTGEFLDLRVDCQHEVVLELRDSSCERIWCGGEQVAGYFRRRDSSARPVSASVRDRNDGTYTISFTPNTPGAYLLAVTINNKPIKGSPFACAARVRRPPRAARPCCAPRAPAARTGCGHEAAPGTRHWSCCGAPPRAPTTPHTPHTSHTPHTPRPASGTYQFSL